MKTAKQYMRYFKESDSVEDIVGNKGMEYVTNAIQRIIEELEEDFKKISKSNDLIAAVKITNRKSNEIRGLLKEKYGTNVMIKNSFLKFFEMKNPEIYSMIRHNFYILEVR